MDGETGKSTGIDRASPETSYQQLARMLTQQITGGQWSLGSKLPPERDLVGRYTVSRATVRSALSILEEQGLIRRVRARGTFVAARPNPRWASTASTILFLSVLDSGPAQPAYMPPNYYALVREGVCQEARKLGMQVRAESLRGYKHVPLKQYQLPRPADVAGVIVCGASDDRYIGMYRSEGVPVVVVDYWTMDLETDCVAVDVEAESHAAVEFLAQRGHSSLGFLAMGRTDQDSRAVDYDPDVWRFLDALRRAAQQRRIHLQEQWVVMVPTVAAGLDASARQLLSLRSRPTAVVCFDLQTADAMFRAAAIENLRCPDDISLITRSWGPLRERTPTMLMSDPVLMGAQATRLLIERRSGKRRHVAKLALPSRLVPGTTTGPAPKGATSLGNL